MKIYYQNISKLKTILIFVLFFFILNKKSLNFSKAQTTISAPTSNSTSTNKDIDENINTQTETGTSSTQAQENVKNKIEQVIENKKDTVDALSNIDETIGFLGKVIKINTEAIDLDFYSDSRLIPITDANIFYKDKKINIKDISVNNWILVIGKKDKNDNIKPSKMYLYRRFEPSEKIVNIGTIQKITKTSITIKTRENETTIYGKLTKKTYFLNSKNEIISRKDIKENTQCILAGYKTSQGTVIIDSIKALGI